MSSSTIKVIVSFDNENKPTEFNFLSEKFNWQNLVTLIQCISSLDPVVLYYYNLSEKRLVSLENQEQLDELLTGVDHHATLRFYGNKDQIKEPAFVGDAFGRLNALVNQHKQVVQSSRRLARWIGILASMIAVAENGEAFEHEFEVLEEMMEKKSSRGRRGTEKTDENDGESNGYDPRQQAFFGRDGPYFGRAFGMGNPFQHAGSRGGFHARGRGGHSFGGRGAHHFGGIGRHGSFGGPEFFGMYGAPFEEFEGDQHHFGNFCGGRGRADLFDTRDKKCKKFKFGHHHFAGRGVSSSSESEDSSEDTKTPLRRKDLKKLRRHHHHGRHGRGFRFAA